MRYLIIFKKPGIVLGDFIENLFEGFAGNKLVEDLHCLQIVTEPTPVSGVLIDHVYISKSYPLSDVINKKV